VTAWPAHDKIGRWEPWLSNEPFWWSSHSRPTPRRRSGGPIAGSIPHARSILTRSRGFSETGRPSPTPWRRATPQLILSTSFPPSEWSRPRSGTTCPRSDPHSSTPTSC